MKGGRWGGGGGQGKPGFTLSSLDAADLGIACYQTSYMSPWSTTPAELDLKPCAWQQLTRLEANCHYLVDASLIM